MPSQLLQRPLIKVRSSYVQFCIIQIEKVAIFINIRIFVEEECPIKGIPEIYSPVCANNGQTYDNIFLLKAANCDSETEIKLVSTGPCETIEKPAKKNSKKKAKRDTAVSKGIINEQRRRVIELKFSFFFLQNRMPYGLHCLPRADMRR